MTYEGIIVGIPQQTYRCDEYGQTVGQIIFNVELKNKTKHRLIIAGVLGKYLARIGQGSVISYEIDQPSKISSKKRIRIYKPFVRNASFIEEAA